MWCGMWCGVVWCGMVWCGFRIHFFDYVLIVICEIRHLFPGYGLALPISWLRRPNNTQVLVKTGKCITFRPPIHPCFKIISPLERSQALVSISGLHLSPTTIYVTKPRFLLDRPNSKILSTCLKKESEHPTAPTFLDKTKWHNARGQLEVAHWC